MSEKREQLEIAKLELEIENLKKDLVYKDFKIKAIAWGLFLFGADLTGKIKRKRGVSPLLSKASVMSMTKR